jgi:uncharacterized membrane protein
MNPVVIVHFLAAAIAIAAALPLATNRVKMNPWYGVRVPAAFDSDANWTELNRYGGRLLLVWGLTLAATAAVGALVRKAHWVAYDWTALGIVLGGLALVVLLIQRSARRLALRR